MSGGSVPKVRSSPPPRAATATATAETAIVPAVPQRFPKGSTVPRVLDPLASVPAGVLLPDHPETSQTSQTSQISQTSQTRRARPGAARPDLSMAEEEILGVVDGDACVPARSVMALGRIEGEFILDMF